MSATCRIWRFCVRDSAAFVALARNDSTMQHIAHNQSIQSDKKKKGDMGNGEFGGV